MESTERQFMDLIHRNRDMIWRVCSGFRLSEAWTTEDAFHEVLCALWIGFQSFDGRSSERTWIYRVAVNTMISIYRKMGNQPTCRAEPDDKSVSPYESIDLNDLIALLDSLPEPDRTIVNAHAQGYSHAEIAQITGLSVAAVGMRLSRALRKLRKQYNQ
ncbi:MAG: sigma-70 family RNA polymerase sigma factor [Bacteroidales bacterium]|nr:sigma-70 family RNA polymerase sigma factor [Bacteroidales bacterium]